MPGGIQPGPVYQLLYDARYIDAGQPASLNLAMAIDGAEQRPGGDARLFHPCL
jgi:hypothetical protein